MKLLKLVARSWEDRIMGTDARLVVVTDDPASGHRALVRAAEDLQATEKALSRFWEHSELSRLNRSGTAVSGERLLIAVREAARAYRWSGGLLDPRVILPLERFGYGRGVPDGDVGEVRPTGPLPPVDMSGWAEESGRISLPPGTRLDLAGVGKALGVGWAAAHLAGHAGLLVDVGGDILALGTDERGEPWNVTAMHREPVGQFSGTSLAVATSTTRKRAWTAGGREAHHLIDPRTGAPAFGELAYATVAAPTILEADLIAKLLVIEGRPAFERFGGERVRAVVTDRGGKTEVLQA
ncbi:FAD:protein FMN transferase [Rubrobacter marinus]|uniref:FAD:protein FMN transferase n=1 Tax=Rubrobacter marinus TaxID=2653852 RepID=A0A6G8PVJ4_9ACTN|nr:FAD:protein FMN transferase [Rubrobacter marinus]QIN78203.1 FAD:protein FMN transferase [Rubrobacter marinus]